MSRSRSLSLSRSPLTSVNLPGDPTAVSGLAATCRPVLCYCSIVLSIHFARPPPLEHTTHMPRGVLCCRRCVRRQDCSVAFMVLPANRRRRRRRRPRSMRRCRALRGHMLVPHAIHMSHMLMLLRHTLCVRTSREPSQRVWCPKGHRFAVSVHFIKFLYFLKTPIPYL